MVARIDEVLDFELDVVEAEIDVLSGVKDINETAPGARLHGIVRIDPLDSRIEELGGGPSPSLAQAP
jgi:hypothetical protein